MQTPRSIEMSGATRQMTQRHDAVDLNPLTLLNITLPTNALIVCHLF